MTGTVTVRHLRSRDRYTIEFSQLAGQTFGPWPFADTIRDLRVSALLSSVEARNVVMEAAVSGKATRELS